MPESEADIDKQLDTDFSKYSSTAQNLQAINQLVDNNGDAMIDLTEEQATANSLMRSFNNNIMPIPATMDLLNNHASLSRSLDRQGREEYASCFKKKMTVSMSRTDNTEDDIDEDTKQAKKGLNLLNKFSKRR